MKKNDRVKIENYVRGIAGAYALCFNPMEVSNRYLNNRVENIFKSSVYNNEFIKMRLEFLEEKNISDMSEGDSEDLKVDKDILKQLRNVFNPCLRNALLEEIEKRKEEIKNRKKDEKEKEVKGKK